MSLLRYLKKGSGSVFLSPGGPLSRHMPSSSIAIREISNRENEYDVNSRNIRPSKITRYTVVFPLRMKSCPELCICYSMGRSDIRDIFHEL